jgi:hypothetical protein
VPERYAPAGPLALAFLAVTEERYADALDRLEQALALSADGQRDLARRLAVRIALDGPQELRARAEVIAESAG